MERHMGIFNKKNHIEEAIPWFLQYYARKVHPRCQIEAREEYIKKVALKNIERATTDFTDSLPKRIIIDELSSFAHDLCIQSSAILAHYIAQSLNKTYLSDAQVADCYLATLFIFTIRFEGDGLEETVFERLIGSFSKPDIELLFALPDETEEDLYLGCERYTDLYLNPDTKRQGAYGIMLARAISMREAGFQTPYEHRDPRYGIDTNLILYASVERFIEDKVNRASSIWYGLVYDIQELCEENELDWWE